MLWYINWPQYFAGLIEAYWRNAYREYARTCGPMMIEVMKARSRTAQVLPFRRRAA
jgi:hypothetical protein